MEVVGDDLWLRIMEEVAVMRRVHRGHKSHKSKGHGFRLVILISDPTMSTWHAGIKIQQATWRFSNLPLPVFGDLLHIAVPGSCSRQTGVEPDVVLFCCSPSTSRLVVLCFRRCFSACCKEWLFESPCPSCQHKPAWTFSSFITSLIDMAFPPTQTYPVFTLYNAVHQGDTQSKTEFTIHQRGFGV